MVITSKHKRVKKRPIEAVIFDYDGVIGKTDSRQFEWFKYWAKRNNTSFSYTTTKEFMEFYNETINNQPKGTNWRDGVQQVYDKLSLPCDMRDKTHPVWPAYDAYKLANPAALYEGNS